jgi:hypothetical protein
MTIPVSLKIEKSLRAICSNLFDDEAEDGKDGPARGSFIC